MHNNMLDIVKIGRITTTMLGTHAELTPSLVSINRRSIVGMLLLEIGFPEGSPEPELIRQKVSKMTGLNIILNHNQDDDVYDLSHTEFRRPCMFEITEKVVSLLLFLASYLYLE